MADRPSSRELGGGPRVGATSEPPPPLQPHTLKLNFDFEVVEQPLPEPPLAPPLAEGEPPPPPPPPPLRMGGTYFAFAIPSLEGAEPTTYNLAHPLSGETVAGMLSSVQLSISEALIRWLVDESQGFLPLVLRRRGLDAPASGLLHVDVHAPVPVDGKGAVAGSVDGDEREHRGCQVWLEPSGAQPRRGEQLTVGSGERREAGGGHGGAASDQLRGSEHGCKRCSGGRRRPSGFTERDQRVGGDRPWPTADAGRKAGQSIAVKPHLRQGQASRTIQAQRQIPGDRSEIDPGEISRERAAPTVVPTSNIDATAEQ